MDQNETEKKIENEKPNKGTIYEEMQIYDTSCNKIRTARNFVTSSYEENGENGKITMKKSVEFIVVGKNRTWKMFMPFDEFTKANPFIKIPGESK